jgi:hypothetical protein
MPVFVQSRFVSSILFYSTPVQSRYRLNSNNRVVHLSPFPAGLGDRQGQGHEPRARRHPSEDEKARRVAPGSVNEVAYQSNKKIKK